LSEDEPSGHFHGTTAFNPGISIGSDAWGLWAKDGGLAEAVRPLASPLSTNQWLEVKFDNSFVDAPHLGPIGTVGISLQNASGENLFEFYFVGGGGYYKVNDSSGERNSAQSFTQDGLLLRFKPVDASLYKFEYGTHTITGNVSSAGDQAVSKFRVFNYSAGDGAAYDLFINDLTVLTEVPTLSVIGDAVKIVRDINTTTMTMVDQHALTEYNGSVISTIPSGILAADDFMLLSNAVITDVTWWADEGATANDFIFMFYEDDNGEPGHLLHVTSGASTTTPTAVYQTYYQAELDVPFRANADVVCVAPPSFWNWSLADAPGNGSRQGPHAAPPWTFGPSITNGDLAFSLIGIEGPVGTAPEVSVSQYPVTGCTNLTLDYYPNESVLAGSSDVYAVITYNDQIAFPGSPLEMTYTAAATNWTLNVDLVGGTTNLVVSFTNNMGDADQYLGSGWSYIVKSCPFPEFSMGEVEFLSSAQIVFRWESVSGETYAVSSASNLLTGFSVITSNIPAYPPMNIYTDEITGVSSRFYRIDQE